MGAVLETGPGGTINQDRLMAASNVTIDIPLN